MDPSEGLADRIGIVDRLVLTACQDRRTSDVLGAGGCAVVRR